MHTMKILQTTQMHLALYGYEANSSPFSKRRKLIYIEIFVSQTAYMAHLLLVANTPKEYMNSIFMVGIAFLCTVSRINTMFKTKTIFIFIDEVEEILNSSKLQLLFVNSFFVYFDHSMCKSSILQQTKNCTSSRNKISCIERYIRENQ